MTRPKMKERMKATKFARLTVFALVLILAAAGCKTKSPDVTQLPKARPDAAGKTGNGSPMTPGNPVVETPNPISTTSGIPTGPGHPGWQENPAIFKANTVHFDFDSATVKSDEKSNVQAVAAHLKGDPTSAIRIEGHCDERGTEEYNRSLGERRALALREELVRNHGIEPDRIDTLSYGEDRPAAAGHDESAWKQNRRGEFILLTPPK
jgi:peptidoglycan-associated lipoprotein